MDKQVKSLLLSFSLGLTNEHEDQKVLHLLGSHPECLSYLLSVEKELQKKINLYGIKFKSQTVLRRKLHKLGIIVP